MRHYILLQCFRLLQTKKWMTCIQVPFYTHGSIKEVATSQTVIGQGYCCVLTHASNTSHAGCSTHSVLFRHSVLLPFSQNQGHICNQDILLKIYCISNKKYTIQACQFSISTEEKKCKQNARFVHLWSIYSNCCSSLFQSLKIA